MKKILEIAMVLGLVGALSVLAQDVRNAEVIDLGKGLKLEMVLIPAGKFIMGTPKKKADNDDENQHAVTLTKPFYLGKYEVSQDQWENVMGKNPSRSTKGAKLPVTNVSWKDCQEFIKKLNAKTDGGYRLPAEAEWEYACRAGTTTAHSFGDKITKSDANYNYSMGGQTHLVVAVGSYKPNAFGLYDMHGNVFEWCEDVRGKYPAGAATDPKGPATGYHRILRGGSFNNFDTYASSSNRFSGDPTFANVYVGFRLAKTK